MATSILTMVVVVFSETCGTMPQKKKQIPKKSRSVFDVEALRRKYTRYRVAPSGSDIEIFGN